MRDAVDGLLGQGLEDVNPWLRAGPLPLQTNGGPSSSTAWSA